MNYYQESPEKVLEELRTTESGLSHQEAGDRLAKCGPNKLAEGKKVTLLQRFIQQLCDPMIIILLVAAAVSGVTAAYSGESFTDVFIILIVVLINAVLGVYQESKAEKAIEALQEMTAATSKVLRDGKMSLLRSDVLVPGDIVILEAGDAVPADCRILESASIKAEEAALTGESVPVEKDVNAIVTDDEVPLGDRHCMLFGVVFGVLGIIFAIMSKKGDRMDSQAKAGLILSIIGVAATVLIIIFFVVIEVLAVIPELN